MKSPHRRRPRAALMNNAPDRLTALLSQWRLRSVFVREIYSGLCGFSSILLAFELGLRGKFAALSLMFLLMYSGKQAARRSVVGPMAAIRWPRTLPSTSATARLHPATIIFKRAFLGAMFLAMLFSVVSTAFAPDAHSQMPREVRRVLILNQLSPFASPGLRLMDEAIIAALQKSPYQVELYTENLETSLFPDEHSQQKFRNWYIEKYRDRKPDVIFTAGPDAIKFMVESHEDYFPGIPVVFCGSTEEMLDKVKLGRDFTGVWAVAQPEKTLQAALQLLPRTKHVVVTGGVGAYDHDLQAIVKASFRKYESTLDFTYLTDEAMPTLLEKLKDLPRNTIIYHTSMMRDTAGTPFLEASQSMPIIAA